MSLAVQFHIHPQQVDRYMLRMEDPERLVENVAWRELVRFVATTDVDALLGERRTVAGQVLQERISARLALFDAGIEIVYVGLQAVHPEPTVAQKFEDVIIAEQEKVTLVRMAQVFENQALSAVAGDRERAAALSEAIKHFEYYQNMRAAGERTAGVVELSGPLARQLDALQPQFEAAVEARQVSERAREGLARTASDVEFGLAGGPEDLRRAQAALAAADDRVAQTDAALAAALTSFRTAAAVSLPPAQIDGAIALAHARFGVAWWDRRLESLFLTLGGQAASEIAQAQADRWRTENQAQADLARLMNERGAYGAAPQVYMQRRYLEVMTEGLKNARKFFLAFDPGGRTVNVRVEAQDTGSLDIQKLPTKTP